MRITPNRAQWSSALTMLQQRQINCGMQQLISVTCHVLTLSLLTPIAHGAATRPLYTENSQPMATTADAKHSLWMHVNKTCLVSTCNNTLIEQHLEHLERNIDWTVNACDDFHTHACGKWAPPSGLQTSASMILVADESLTARYVELFERSLNDRQAQRRGVAAVAAAVTRAAQRQQVRRARRQGTHETAKHISAAASGSEKQLETALNIEVPIEAYDTTTEAEDYDLVLSKLLQYYRVCKRAELLTLRGYYDEIQAEGLLRPQQRHWQIMQANLARYGYGEQFVFFRVRQQNATQHDITVLPHDTHKRLNLTAEIYEILRAHTHKSRAELATEFRTLETHVEGVVNNMCAGDGVEHSNSVRSTTARAEQQAINDQSATPISAEEDCDLTETLTFAELTRRCGDVDWQRLIGAPLGRHLHSADPIRIDSVATVCKLARYHNQAKHAHINFLYTLARFLSYLQQQQYNPVRLGSSGATCIRHMRKTLPVVMTYVYDRAYYAPVRADSDRVILSVFAQLKAEFARTITLNRMQFDSDIVEYLQQKLLTLRINLGNLPPAVNSSFYVDLLWKLNVSHNNFYRNHMNALVYTYGHLRRLASSASKKHNRSAWYTFNYHEPTFPDNLDATPYYFCLSNMIIVPYAYLQTPFYDHQFWSILVYGDLANTLGHELIHSFDSSFLEYDHAGNMNELMMQRISSNVNFARNTHCLSQGTKFLAERIADVSGTRLALNAFLRDPEFVKTNGRLFFLQFAQFFCSNTDEATHQLQDHWHDTDAVRLNYTLSQIPEFMEAFSCPAESRMNVLQPCGLW